MTDNTEPLVFLIKVARDWVKNNNYLVVDPSTLQAVLVDPAWEIEKIEDAVGRARATLSGILITHAHPDHIDLAEPLAHRHNIPIWISEHEAAESAFSAPQMVTIDETPWTVGALYIEPFVTPGHTAGSVCYRIGCNLFTGDTLFPEGCGICPDEPSAHAMFESLSRLKSCLDPATHIFPGHTYVRPPGERFGDMMDYNIYLHFGDKDSFTSFRMRRGQTAKKLFDFI